MGAYVDGKPFSVELVAAVNQTTSALISIEGLQTSRL